MNFESANYLYANYSFTEGLLMLLFDFVFYSALGYYID